MKEESEVGSLTSFERFVCDLGVAYGFLQTFVVNQGEKNTQNSTKNIFGTTEPI